MLSLCWASWLVGLHGLKSPRLSSPARIVSSTRNDPVMEDPVSPVTPSSARFWRPSTALQTNMKSAKALVGCDAPSLVYDGLGFSLPRVIFSLPLPLSLPSPSWLFFALSLAALLTTSPARALLHTARRREVCDMEK